MCSTVFNVPVYLDEIQVSVGSKIGCPRYPRPDRLTCVLQDFSYSSIYLVCSLAGRINRHWVAAGDIAQMISPGCSFTFDGMKQVLRAIDQETQLSKVVKRLTRNYRTTRGVLEVGNAILQLLKQHFPSAIDSIKPREVAMKDLGLRVVLCDWDNATKEHVSFGVQQAVVLSSPKNETRWTRQHQCKF